MQYLLDKEEEVTMIHQAAAHQAVQAHFQEYSRQISKLQPVYLVPQPILHAIKLLQTQT
jgi:hypothetical protein